MPTIGFVVPDLDGGGGVPAVARFLLKVANQSPKIRVRLVSLPSASRHPTHTSLGLPWTILRGVRVSPSTWEGHDYVTVGACAGEFEFMRYMPRRALSAVLDGCDLVQVACGTPAWARAVEGLGFPVSIHVATLAKVERASKHEKEVGPLSTWRKAMTRLTSHLDDLALRDADAVQAMNPWLVDYAKRLRGSIGSADVCYGAPGIDASLFRPGSQSTQRGKPYILCVGRLDDPRKNMDLLLSAYAILATKFPTLDLFTAGSSAPHAGFFEQASRLGLGTRVRHILRPSTESLVALYQGATVFVSSSDEEGFGVAIVEAMSCGIPVVSTKSGGPEGIITSGENGFLVDLRSPHQIADAVATILGNEDLGKRLGTMARKTVLQRFSNDSAGQVFLEVWDKLTSQVRPRPRDSDNRSFRV